MSMSPCISTHLTKLVEADPGLSQKLQKIDGMDEAVELMMASAKRHDIDLDADQLSASLRVTVNLAKLTELEPSLLKTLQEADDADQALRLILPLAERHGVELDRNMLASQLAHVASKDKTLELTDQELSHISGGINLQTMADIFKIGRTLYRLLKGKPL